MILTTNEPTKFVSTQANMQQVTLLIVVCILTHPEHFTVNQRMYIIKISNPFDFMRLRQSVTHHAILSNAG